MTYDELGINADADALAAIIASRSVSPPLSVGIFGQEGSGRSFLAYKLKVSKEPNGTCYMPTDKAAVDSGAYPISRPLYMATNGKPKGAVAAFLQWIVGPEGQAVVEREGFFTVGEGKYKAANDKNFK